MKVPRMSLPKMSAGKGSLSSVAAPKFLVDLFRDIRDRGLLPVAGALIVAIVAVPMLLAGGSTPAPPPPAPSAAAAISQSAPGAAVVVSNHGIRNLGGRKLGSPKDPFKQRMQVIDTSGSQLGVGASGPTTTISSALGAAAGSSSSTSGGSSGSSSGSSSGGSSGGSRSHGGSNNSSSQPADPLPPAEVIPASYVVDTRVTRASSTEFQNRNDVAFLDPLPTAAKPVFTFAGVTDDAKKALFLLPNSTSVTGGVCVIPVSAFPPGLACPLVALEPGEKIQTVYTPEPLKLYTLKLDSIHRP
ncbi:MAG: hypothetical protein QOG09_296 [Solirubrobacterales bacterium]|nr:hypothetical protein [Solirubrobacterales bacterium]